MSGGAPTWAPDDHRRGDWPRSRRRPGRRRPQGRGRGRPPCRARGPSPPRRRAGRRRSIAARRKTPADSGSSSAKRRTSGEAGSRYSLGPGMPVGPIRVACGEMLAQRQKQAVAPQHLALLAPETARKPASGSGRSRCGRFRTASPAPAVSARRPRRNRPAIGRGTLPAARETAGLDQAGAPLRQPRSSGTAVTSMFRTLSSSRLAGE